MGTAKHRAIDYLRRGTLVDRKHEDLGREMAEKEMQVPDLAAAMDDTIGDDMLRLVFISCHPVLSMEARVALTLRLLGGLTTDEIARAFLVGEPTIAQRIVRAKRTLSEARVPFEVPRGTDFTARLSSVLQVIYLIFNEGYAASSGDDWMRPALCYSPSLRNLDAMPFSPLTQVNMPDTPGSTHKKKRAELTRRAVRGSLERAHRHALLRQNLWLTRTYADCADTWLVLMVASTPKETVVALAAWSVTLAPVVRNERGRSVPGAANTVPSWLWTWTTRPALISSCA